MMPLPHPGQQLILDNIARHILLTPDEQQHFLGLLRPLQVKRKAILLREGEVCRHSTFVTAGCLRSYFLDESGIEHVMGFAPEDWWIGDMYSLISQLPGTLYIDALQASTVLQLSKEHQEQLYLDIPKFERFFRILIEKSLVSNQQRLLENMTLSAQERYLHFCKRYPGLVTTLPKKQIASYIGVTPEFFSKMTGRFAK